VPCSGASVHQVAGVEVLHGGVVAEHAAQTEAHAGLQGEVAHVEAQGGIDVQRAVAEVALVVGNAVMAVVHAQQYIVRGAHGEAQVELVGVDNAVAEHGAHAQVGADHVVLIEQRAVGARLHHGGTAAEEGAGLHVEAVAEAQVRPQLPAHGGLVCGALRSGAGEVLVVDPELRVHLELGLGHADGPKAGKDGEWHSHGLVCFTAGLCQWRADRQGRSGDKGFMTTS
jgi:hypothetical protein